MVSSAEEHTTNPQQTLHNLSIPTISRPVPTPPYAAMSLHRVAPAKKNSRQNRFVQKISGPFTLAPEFFRKKTGAIKNFFAGPGPQ